MTSGGKAIRDEGVVLGHQPGPAGLDRRHVLGQDVGLLPEPDSYPVTASAVRLGAHLMGTDADDPAGARVGAVMATAKGHRLTMPGAPVHPTSCSARASTQALPPCAVGSAAAAVAPYL